MSRVPDREMAPRLRKTEHTEVIVVSYHAGELAYRNIKPGQIHANQGNAHLRAVDCIA